VARYTFSSARRGDTLTKTLGVLLCLSVLLNLYLLLFGGDGGDDDADPEAAETDAVAEEGETPAASAAEDAAVPADPAGELAPPAGTGGFEQLELLDLDVSGSLSALFDKAVAGRRSVWLTARTSRILMWCIDLHKDMRAGDRLQILYQPEGTEEVTIAAMRYESSKMDRVYRAYHFKPAGEEWASWWDESGREVPARLENSPIRHYEEITAVLGDGRDHRGYDFKAPVGTPVVAVKDASVLRTTWNFKYNGNSLELRYSDGTIARYLHLEELSPGIQEGVSVKAGQQVATSGNTGRTNAPHLHYEVEQAGRVVDPVDYHGETHRTLDGDDLAAFQALFAQFDTSFGATAAP